MLYMGISFVGAHTVWRAVQWSLLTRYGGVVRLSCTALGSGMAVTSHGDFSISLIHASWLYYYTVSDFWLNVSLNHIDLRD